MIELNNKKLCECCFSEINEETCPNCGYNKNTYICDPTVLPCGSILAGRYIVGKVIGKGGFGITYLAYDNKTDSKVAIKEYYPNGLASRTLGKTTLVVSNENDAKSFQAGAEKFYSEAKLVSRFNGNPGIVSVYEFFYENDTVYFAMEYLNGKSLKDYLNDVGAITEGHAVYIADCVSSALLAAHSSNVMHRDISPDNIMLCDDGTVKLIDFGAARQVTAESSQNLSVILKPGFAPLEQYQKKGKQGPWTDIYALGATLYYALTLDTIDDPMSRMEDDEEFQKNSHGISENLWKVIVNSTKLKAEERYRDIFEFRKALSETGITPDPLIVPEQEEAIPEFRTAQPFNASRQLDTQQTQPVKTNDEPQEKKQADGSFFKTAAEKLSAFIKTKKGRITAVSALAVVVVGISVAAIASNAKKEDDYLPAYNDNAVTGVVSTGEVFVTTAATTEKITMTTTEATTTAATTTTAKKTTTSTTSSSGQTKILGNTVANIKNGGFTCSGAVANNYNGTSEVRAYVNGEWKTVIETSKGEVSNLCWEGNNLFHIYNERICYYNTTNDSWNYVDGLERYSAEIMNLYISKDYYFIYTKDYSDDIGVLHRVSRANCNEEESLEIDYSTNLTFSDNDLFYVSKKDGRVVINKVSSCDFQKDAGYSWTFNDNVSYADNLVFNNGYLYCNYNTTEGKVCVQKLTDKLEHVETWNFATSCKNATGYDKDNYISCLNVVDDQMFFLISYFGVERSDLQAGLYHYVIGNDDVDRIQPPGANIWNLTVFGHDDFYEVNYMSTDDGKFKYLEYDLNGKKIEE